jgi:RNA polymerase sigma factor (sigma-70 family)
MGVSAAIAGFRLDRGSVLGDSDEYLVARLRAGDDAAFEAIYDRYARGLLAFCVHMLGSREAAEDALQLTFVSAFRALRRGESNIVLRPWLYTIARNRCLSELRTRCDFVDVDGVVVDRPFLEGVVDQVERREDLREMLQDMQRLPADQRAALVLFELGDHSHEEIAAVLGVRKEKVKALVFQAREALMRGRRARERPCAEIRERLATLQGTVLARSMARAHIDRCPSCAAFESEVRRQHAALALLLPVALTSQLKASVLGSALRSGYALAATGGTAAGGAGGAGALAAGGATAAGGAGGAGALAAGGVTAAGGAGAAAAGSVAAATGAASTAVIAGAPSVAAVATGLTAVGADYAASVGVGGLGATGVLAKILTAAAIATAGAGAIHDSTHGGHPLPSPLAVLVAPATPSNPAAALTIALTPATPLSSAPTAGAPTDTTTTAPATAPGTTATTTATALAAAPSTGPTDTAAASVPAATTTTTPAAASSTGTTGTSAPSAPAATTTTTPAAASSTGTTGTSAPSAPAATTTTTPAAASSTGTTGTSAPSAPATTTTTTPVAAPSTTTTATSPPASSTDSTGTVAPSAPATTTTTSPSATPNTDSTDIAPSVAQ